MYLNSFQFSIISGALINSKSSLLSQLQFETNRTQKKFVRRDLELVENALQILYPNKGDTEILQGHINNMQEESE